MTNRKLNILTINLCRLSQNGKDYYLFKKKGLVSKIVNMANYYNFIYIFFIILILNRDVKI
jgi:hypothetical protein